MGAPLTKFKLSHRTLIKTKLQNHQRTVYSFDRFDRINRCTGVRKAYNPTPLASQTLEPGKQPFGIESEHDLSNRLQLARIEKAVLGDDVNVSVMSGKVVIFADAGGSGDFVNQIHRLPALEHGLG